MICTELWSCCDRVTRRLSIPLSLLSINYATGKIFPSYGKTTNKGKTGHVLSFYSSTKPHWPKPPVRKLCQWNYKSLLIQHLLLQSRLEIIKHTKLDACRASEMWKRNGKTTVLLLTMSRHLLRGRGFSPNMSSNYLQSRGDLSKSTVKQFNAMGLNFLTKQVMKDLELLQQAILLNSGSIMPHLSINLQKIGT